MSEMFLKIALEKHLDVICYDIFSLINYNY